MQSRCSKKANYTISTFFLMLFIFKLFISLLIISVHFQQQNHMAHG